MLTCQQSTFTVWFELDMTCKTFWTVSTWVWLCTSVNTNMTLLFTATFKQLPTAMATYKVFCCCVHYVWHCKLPHWLKLLYLCLQFYWLYFADQSCGLMQQLLFKFYFRSADSLTYESECCYMFTPSLSKYSLCTSCNVAEYCNT